jgi:hypothetical protein
MPIVAQALYAYFIKGIPVKETIENCRDIMEFCISQKSASSFSAELHGINGKEQLQKTNRFYITKKGGSFIKRAHFSNKLIGLYVGRLVRILNNYDKNDSFESYDVDFGFYEKEVMKIIDEIEPKQTTLFDMSTIFGNKIIKMKLPSSVSTPAETKINVVELNRLGKNQLAKKIESIINNKQIVEKISPRYVYILDFDSKLMSASVYCLSKGIKQSIDVDKKAYKETKLNQGQLVFCSKFSKINDKYTLVEYKVTEKIVEEVRELELA